jgi:hypothetical protein
VWGLEKTRQKLRLRNYNFKTIKAYLRCLREYFDFKKINLEKINEENIKQFLMPGSAFAFPQPPNFVFRFAKCAAKKNFVCLDSFYLVV